MESTITQELKKNSKTGRKQVEYKTQQSYAESIIPLEVYESGATSSCGIINDEFILID